MNRFNRHPSSSLPTDRLHGASACGANMAGVGGRAEGVLAELQGVPAALSGSMPGQTRELATLMYRIAYEAALSQVEHEANVRNHRSLN
jgi:hypothetical protein